MKIARKKILTREDYFTFCFLNFILRKYITSKHSERSSEVTLYNEMINDETNDERGSVVNLQERDEYKKFTCLVRCTMSDQVRK